jgi:hydrogenase maturation protease
MKTLVIGYGNPGRQDDALGPAVANEVETWNVAGVEAATDFQLNIEYAADLANVETVIFVDASRTGAEDLVFRELEPARQISFTTHSLDPASLLALCEDIYKKRTRAFLLAIRGYEFEFAEGLSPGAKANLDKALQFLKRLLALPPEQWPA